MQLIGETICHTQFGKGVVTACDRNIITVDFPTGKKRFVYPDAFEGYLVPKDTTTKNQINDLLVEQKLQEKQQQLQNLEHQKKLAHLRSLKISNNGQAVFDLDNQQKNDPLTSGCCSTGTYLSGCSKGEYRIPQQMNFNSMCLLTRCPEGEPEQKRQILAIAMAEEGFEGGNREDGQIPLHPQYRLKLERPVELWPHLQKDPRKNWGHTAFRYISNQAGEEILWSLLKEHKGSRQEEELREFYRYYCECNRLTSRM